jgi:hypothetical protein
MSMQFLSKLITVLCYCSAPSASPGPWMPCHNTRWHPSPMSGCVVLLYCGIGAWATPGGLAVPRERSTATVTMRGSMDACVVWI